MRVSGVDGELRSTEIVVELLLDCVHRVPPFYAPCRGGSRADAVEAVSKPETSSSGAGETLARVCVACVASIEQSQPSESQLGAP